MKKHKAFIKDTCEKEIEHLQAELKKWSARTYPPLSFLYPFDVPEAKVKQIISMISRFEIILQFLEEE